MHLKTNPVIGALLTAVLAAALLGGCQPAKTNPTPASAQSTQQVVLPALGASGQAASVPSSAQPYPAAGTGGQTVAAPTSQPAASYPAPDGNAAASQLNTTGSGYPGPGPAAMPAIDNHSTVTAELIEKKAGETADLLILRVKVTGSEAINGGPEFTNKLLNQEAEFIVNAAGLADVKPGDTFTAQVSYRGDENGGKYYADRVEIKK